MILVNLRQLAQPILATRRFRVDSRHGLLPATLMAPRNSFIKLQQRSFSEEAPKNDWLNFVKRVFQAKLLVAAVIFVVGSIPLSYAYVAYVGYKDARALKRRLEQGSGESLIMAEKTLIDRPELKKLQKLLTPSAPNIAKKYWLIDGEHGTGKTTAVKKACKTIGSGVIYVDVPENVSRFALAFSKATDYEHRVSAFFPWLNQMIFKEMTIAVEMPFNQGNWMAVYDEFKKTAEWYQTVHQKVPVLVIDNVNKMAEQNPEMLATLQDCAKNAIDNRLFVTVFVSSDGMAPQQITGRSAFSRGRSYHIGDIDRDQVFEYLQKSGVANTDGTLYSRVFALVGGRLILLSDVSADLLEGASFEDVKKALFADVQGRVEQCWKTVEDKNILQAIFECVNANSACFVEDVEPFLKKPGTTVNVEKIRAVGDEMTSANLLSKVRKSTWTFHSNVEKSYFKEHPQVAVML